MHSDSLMPSHLHPNNSVVPFNADVSDMPRMRMPPLNVHTSDHAQRTHQSGPSSDPVDGMDPAVLVPGDVRSAVSTDWGFGGSELTPD